MNSKVIKLFEENILPNNNTDYLTRHLKNLEFKNFSYHRKWSLLEFRRFVKKYNLSSDHCVNFNGEDPECKELPTEKLTILNFDDKSQENDLHTINYKDFCDFIIVSQTLEHVYNPFKCVKNIFEMLETGGCFYTSVPTINRLHGYPFNFTTGFTPSGLMMLLVENGFEILEVGQWGNRKYISKLFKSRLWSTEKFLKKGITHLGDLKSPFDIIKDGRINEFDWPTDTWALCRKPK
jgi:hypothetical protein